jgi:glycosyltransferase involved in cell wall biosynthesis
VRFLGYRAYDALGPCYEGAHAFAFPTEYDVWGLVLVEAMAAGLPAVASTRAGATRDLVVDGETGFAVNFEDTKSAAARIRELGTTPARAADMGQAARNRIRDHFTLEKSADGWLELLERY